MKLTKGAPFLSVGRFKSVFLATVSGLLIILSFPNFNLSFLAFIALIPLLVAMEGVSPKTAFKLGWLCGVVAYSGMLYWIMVVMGEYGHLPIYVTVPLWLLLSSWLAIFYGLATFATAVGEGYTLKSALILPLAWVGGDYLRSFILSGFPWGMLGHSQYRLLPLIQISDITGVYGITAIIVLANIVIYRVVRGVSGASVPYPVKSAITFLLMISVTLGYGFIRLNQPPSAAKGVRVALIQGNIDQGVKWSPEFREKTVDIYCNLSRQAVKGQKADLIVWPESAAPFYFQENSSSSERIRNLARELDTYILFGSPAAELRDGRFSNLNSAFLLAPDGSEIGRGDKIHLVPFGEYVPMARLLPFVNKMVHGIGDFVPGEQVRPLVTKDARLGLLVCYEAIFPELALAQVNAGSNLLVNITNDAWFGRTSAPYQHLSIAAFRAVETRTPLIRAANTGVTSIIDQNGHIRGMTSLFREGVMVGMVKPDTRRTLYLEYGNLFARCSLLLVPVLLFAYRLRAGRRK